MPDFDLSQLTLSALLTTAGAATLAAVVTGLVAVLGRLFVLTGNEARVAAVIAALFVLALAVQAVVSGVMQPGIPLVLAVVLAWYAVTRLAMSIYDDVTGKPSGLRGQ